MPSARLEDGDVGVRIDTDLGGDLEAALHDFLRRQIRVLPESACRGQGVAAAGAYGEDAVIWLDDVTRARDDEAVLAIGDREKCFEPAQHPIAAPILGELHSRALKIARVSLELFLELFEECERISGGSREPSDQFAAVQAADFLGVRLHHRLADGDLAVAAERDLPVFANGQDCGRADSLAIHRSKLTPDRVKRGWAGFSCAPFLHLERL